MDNMDSIRGGRSSEILLSLVEKPKNVQEILASVGGSATTLQGRIEELLQDGLIREDVLKQFPFTRKLSLTNKGKVLVGLIKKVNMSLKGPIPKTREKWLLSLIYGLNGVKGATRLEKLSFLLSEELKAVDGEYYDFVAEKYGPYSKDIIDDVSELDDIGLIEINWTPVELDKPNEEVKRMDFKLTDLGSDVTKDVFDDLPNKTKEAISSLKKFNEMKLDDLLDYVHKKYPKYCA